MRHISGRTIAAAAVLSVLLLCDRTGLADDADDSATVRVMYASGPTTIAVLSETVAYFTNRKYLLGQIPPEIQGLKFTRRACRQASDVMIDAPSGVPIYLLVDTDTDGGQHATEKAVQQINKSLAASGWKKLGDLGIVGRKNAWFAIYGQTFADARRFTLTGGFSGVVVAAKSLVLDAGDGNGGSKPDETAEASPASTLHIDSIPDTTPIPGPSTRPAQPQATVDALEVYEMDNGMMLGQTSEATLTLTASATPKPVTVRFVTKVGNQMTLARDEALRYIHLKYPNWYVSKAEITFEDKYVAHDGGSIGAAIGTVILSCIQGFNIDPNVAITGDISANGKVRAIGGVSAKIKGAIASKCTLVAIPAQNIDQLTDAVIYNGPGIISDIQVIGIANLDDAVATLRTDRDAKLTEAIALFAQAQKSLKNSSSLSGKDVRSTLQQVLTLAPQHLSAQLLLAMAQGKAPATLSAAASEYYTFESVGSMVDALKERSGSKAAQSVPSSVVRTGLAKLRELRPLADPTMRPLIDAWVRFIAAWNQMQEGLDSPKEVEQQRQLLLDEMAKENADADLMQKMLKEGI